jgi:hypothetical protein
MRRGAYTLRASAAHALGFLDMAPVEMKFRVEPRFALTLTAAPIAFDTMAEEGALPLRAPATIEVTGPAEIPIDIDVELRLPEGRIARDVHIEPTHFTFGPNRPRKVELRLQWQNPRALRGESFHYQGEIALMAQTEHARMLTGKTSWVMPVDGKLRAWDWRRYFKEYKWQILGGLAALLLIVYLIGRSLAQKFPPKARIHYAEVGQAFESESLIRRYARHGAYRSARFRFPLGKKARPLAVFKSTGARFEVIPEKTVVTILDETVPQAEREKRGPFKGSWDQRYRLGDRYEVWLTRT